MRVLVACEFSGVVREAFRRNGHEAWSCDLLPAEDGSPYHFKADITPELRGGLFGAAWDLLIAHPPCTYLTRAGWRWVNAPDCATLPLKGEPRRQAARAAAEFFNALLDAPIPRIAVENPRPIVHVNLPASSQIIQPWMFGHGERKETHLWLKNLPPLVPTHIVPGRTARVHREPPSRERWKNRSRTYQGIADAMAAQWGEEPWPGIGKAERV